MIKKQLIFSLFILLAVGTSAQSSKLVPGASFTNQSTDTLYMIPMQQVKSLLSSAVNNDINEQKLELYKNKISLFEERSALADSAMTIKKLEASYWHSQSRVYYLVAGRVAGAVLVSL